jgi:anti-anti-sigma factor
VPSGFASEVEQGDGLVRVVLKGEFDLSVVPSVEDEIHRVEESAPLMVIDLSGLQFMDSSGLRTLVTADDRARRDGRRVVLVQGPPPVHRVFEITQLTERLEIVEDASAVTGASS